MIISTKGRYALRLMVDLAEHQNDRSFISLKDIAGRQEFSQKYVEQLLPLLSDAGLIVTRSGHYGGCRLSRSPSEYTLGEILRATEKSLSPVSCLEEMGSVCPRKMECVTFPIWKGLDDMINSYLNGITLQNLLDQHSAY